MNKKIIIFIFAGLILVGAGVATFFIFDMLNNKPSSTMVTPPETTETESLSIEQQDVIVKNLLSKISSEVLNYQSNNRGALPTTETMLSEFVNSYLDDTDLTNPATDTPYQVVINPSETESNTVIGFKPRYVCTGDDNTGPALPGSSRQFAVTALLPSGTDYCVGN